ncbi:hypothetical protein SCAR479_12934 [Seiridium cardinale]|uniref:F-box domain-containing protein n=1 Tax=Seiridium cardinale TaxID=138064 RepID=A0ABR2X9G9_9PEZI
MDRLPQEIVDLIASFLFPEIRLSSSDEDEEGWTPYAKSPKPEPSLAPFATISRAWQAAVERRTFQSIKFDSEDLPAFKQALTLHRYLRLKRMIFTVILPSYDTVAASKVETQQDRSANSQAYSDALQSLFEILKSSELGQPRSHSLELFINHPESRSDIQWSASRGISGSDGQIYEGRYFHSYIDVYNPDKLPQLHHVTRFFMKMPKDQLGHRMLYPRVPIQIVSKLPNVESFCIDVNDNERLYIRQRREHRRELAEQIQKLSLPRLKTADLHFLYSSPEDHRYLPPMLHPTTEFDLLSSVCHSFSQGLVELSLNGVLDISALQPISGCGVTLWPNLEQLDIHFHQVRPFGGWYFTGTPPIHLPEREPQSEIIEEDVNEGFHFHQEMAAIGMQPTCYFRSKPDDGSISPMVDAFADAVAHMPKIRNAMIHSTLVKGNFAPEWFVVAYVAPCKNPDTCQGKCNRSKERNLILDLQGWDPSEQLMRKLQSIGSKFYDRDLLEESMDEFLSRNGKM